MGCHMWQILMVISSPLWLVFGVGELVICGCVAGVRCQVSQVSGRVSEEEKVSATKMSFLKHQKFKSTS